MIEGQQIATFKNSGDVLAFTPRGEIVLAHASAQGELSTLFAPVDMSAALALAREILEGNAQVLTHPVMHKLLAATVLVLQHQLNPVVEA